MNYINDSETSHVMSLHFLALLLVCLQHFSVMPTYKWTIKIGCIFSTKGAKTHLVLSYYFCMPNRLQSSVIFSIEAIYVGSKGMCWPVFRFGAIVLYDISH